MRRKEETNTNSASAGSNAAQNTNSRTHSNDTPTEKPSRTLIVVYISFLFVYSILALVFMTPLIFPRYVCLFVFGPSWNFFFRLANSAPHSRSVHVVFIFISHKAILCTVSNEKKSDPIPNPATHTPYPTPSSICSHYPLSSSSPPESPSTNPTIPTNYTSKKRIHTPTSNNFTQAEQKRPGMKSSRKHLRNPAVRGSHVSSRGTCSSRNVWLCAWGFSS